MLGRRTITYTRRTTGVASATGRPSITTATPVEFVASVQPLTGIDLQQLPEGERSRDARKLYTTTALRTSAAGTTDGADRVTIDGVNYHVHDIESYDAQAPMPHFKVTILREGSV